MSKDSLAHAFRRHTPVRDAGSEVRKRVTSDASFLLKYRHSECAQFYVSLDYGESYFILYGFNLSFCLGCGRFIGFGAKYELCWICESELESFEEVGHY